MKVEFTAEQQKLRSELRAYFEKLMTPALSQECAETMGEGGGPLWREALRQMGRDGWIGLGWSKELGGQGMTPIEQFIFVEEVMRVGYPFPFLTTESVGPQLAEHGNAWHREELVPKILAGDLLVAIGYSESAAGTDLASLKTSAVKDGNEWVINGQKMWTSLAHFCDYTWLAVRTDPNAPKKHKGISIFLVPNSDPGWSATPVHTLGGVRTNATYYENIRLDEKYLVGELHQGWKLITGQLNRERLTLVNVGPTSNLFNRVTEWAQQADYGSAGGKLIDQPWVQLNLAKVRVGVEALKLLCYKQAWAMTEGTLEMADASAAKVYGSEYFIEAYRLLGEVIGQASLINRRSASDTVLEGRIETLYRTASIITFGGGANEIQRDIISAAGLWMPRASR
ncbi:MAG: alkylation response protein AidB-like acyl-CoA dehydrogenase [Halieaceae bacterium]|jgi:alkylation response protein AidB-like acyl-CoA dehydrogenase